MKRLESRWCVVISSFSGMKLDEYYDLVDASDWAVMFLIDWFDLICSCFCLSFCLMDRNGSGAQLPNARVDDGPVRRQIPAERRMRIRFETVHNAPAVIQHSVASQRGRACIASPTAPHQGNYNSAFRIGILRHSATTSRILGAGMIVLWCSMWYETVNQGGNGWNRTFRNGSSYVICSWISVWDGWSLDASWLTLIRARWGSY